MWETSAPMHGPPLSSFFLFGGAPRRATPHAQRASPPTMALRAPSTQLQPGGGRLAVRPLGRPQFTPPRRISSSSHHPHPRPLPTRAAPDDPRPSTEGDVVPAVALDSPAVAAATARAEGPSADLRVIAARALKVGTRMGWDGNTPAAPGER